MNIQTAENQAQGTSGRMQESSVLSVRPQAQQPVSSKATNASASVSKLSSSLSSAGRISAANDDYNAIAQSARLSDKRMAEIASNVADMKVEVQAYRKHYPPFLHQSPEQEKMVRKAMSFRDVLVERLTIPPAGDRFAGRIMGESSTTSFDVEIGRSGRSVTINAQPVHSGPEGIDIPKINEGSDEEFAELAEKLDRAEKVIEERRAALAKDMEKVAAGVGSDLVHSYADEIKAKEREEEFESMSRDIGLALGSEQKQDSEEVVVTTEDALRQLL